MAQKIENGLIIAAVAAGFVTMLIHTPMLAFLAVSGACLIAPAMKSRLREKGY